MRRHSGTIYGLKEINRNTAAVGKELVISSPSSSSTGQMIPDSPKFKKIKTYASKSCMDQDVYPEAGAANGPDHRRDEASSVKKQNATATSRKMQPADYLPTHLTRYVQHSHGDFYISSSFEPRLIAQLMYEGFLPIATPRYLVPKLHKERCVIYPLNRRDGSIVPRNRNDSSKDNPSSANTIATIDKSVSAVHISKNVKKRAKNFRMTINQAFDQVVQGCHDQHGIGWLYPPIVDAFRIIHEGSTLQDFHSFPVRLYSIEVWNANTGKLAGGELGYSVGTMYTSLTGFACEDSAGSVQLAALGTFLWSCGFELWDFGMKLDYKSKLGAEDMSRDEFVAKVKELRGKSMGLMRMDERICCKSLIMGCTRNEG